MQRRVWFILGASNGFGRLLCEAVLKRGDYAVAAARDIKSLRALAHTYGDALLLQRVDATRRSQIFDAVHRGRAHFGRLCVIVAAAGYPQFGAIEEVSREEAVADIETNVLGLLSLIQAALPILRAQGFGHILPVSASGGSTTSSMCFPVARFATEGLVEALNAEVSRFGIKLTLIDPGAGLSLSLAEQPARHAKPLLVYDEMRKQPPVSISQLVSDDFSEMANAIFGLVESPRPPLRMLLEPLLLPAHRYA